MKDPATLLVSGSAATEIVRAYNLVVRELSPEMGKRLSGILSNYLARFGLEGVYERLNNRTVAQIVAEFEPGAPKVVASGEADGLRFTLYEAPGEKPD